MFDCFPFEINLGFMLGEPSPFLISAEVRYYSDTVELFNEFYIESF